MPELVCSSSMVANVLFALCLDFPAERPALAGTANDDDGDDVFGYSSCDREPGKSPYEFLLPLRSFRNRLASARLRCRSASSCSASSFFRLISSKSCVIEDTTLFFVMMYVCFHFFFVFIYFVAAVVGRGSCLRCVAGSEIGRAAATRVRL